MLLFRSTLLFLSLLFLNACSGNQAIESLFAPNSKLLENSATINSAGNDSNPTNSSEEKNLLPANLPSEIPIYSPAKLIKNEDNKTTWNSSDPLNLINNFYQQELKNPKWSISEQQDNLLIATNSDNNKQLKISFLPSGEKTTFTIEYPFNSPISVKNTNISTTNSESPENEQNVAEKAEINSYIQDLVALDIINQNPDTLDPNKIVTRREYARWLITANNTIYGNSPSKQVRLANKNDKPVFTDVKNQDPDFAEIQGLAEAGFIPSSLTQDANAVMFRPDAPLTREDLISWKVPLDTRQALPNASLDTIKETWGFKDASKINPQVWPSLYVDWQNGDKSNLKRTFGYTTLFQPQKSVTLTQAATVLWYFGDQNNGISASELLSVNNAEKSNSL